MFNNVGDAYFQQYCYNKAIDYYKIYLELMSDISPIKTASIHLKIASSYY